MGEALTASLTGPEMAMSPPGASWEKTENIASIEVTPESPALAQGEKRKRKSDDGEGKREGESEIERGGKFSEATCQMGHARSVLCPAMFFSVLTIRCKNTQK